MNYKRRLNLNNWHYCHIALVKGVNLMKKYITLLLINILILCLFSSCSKKISQISTVNQKIKIGVCMASFTDKYGSYLLDEMKKYSKTLSDVEVVFTDAKNDSNIQLSQVEHFISQRVDAIVVTPAYRDATKSMTDKAKAAKIPIISFMGPFENENDAVSYIAPDSFQAATLQMEYLAKKMNYKGNVAIIMGPLIDQSQRERTEACRVVVAKYPDMKIVAEQAADWNRAKAMALMENWLQSGKEIDVVASNNDEMAIGALQAIEEAGKLDKIIVGGIDATPDALEYLKSGKLAVTSFQDAITLAQYAIDTAVKAAKGDTIEKTINIKNELVIPEDADKYIAKWKNK